MWWLQKKPNSIAKYELPAIYTIYVHSIMVYNYFNKMVFIRIKVNFH